MRPNRKALIPALATGSLIAALGLTAIPMLSVWHQPEPAITTAPGTYKDFSGLYTSDSEDQARFALEFNAVPGEIVVDLRGNVNAAEVQDINGQYGLNLRPNSIEAKDDGIYVTGVGSNPSESDLLARLKSDNRIDAAEPEQIYTIPDPELEEQDPALAASSRQIDVVTTGRIIAVSDYPNQTGGPGYIYLRTPDSGSVPAGFGSGTSNTDRYNGIDAPNDPRYGEQWNFQMVGAEEAWKRSHGKGVVVAVIDTGVSVGATKKGVACRDFGQTNFAPGYDFVNKDSDPYDDQGHGTHVAGTIAESTNNNEGVAGLAFEATIMPIKVLSASGSGTSADVADGIRYAADHGANVINMSLGSSQPSLVIQRACQYAHKKGVVIVCAAGNSFREGVGYPAAYPECIAVSAVGPNRQLAKYSSYGKQVALAAPGGDMIDSRDPADGILQNTNFPEKQGGRGDDYYAFQGTSMATPHVAAVAALIEAQGIKDPARVKDILLKSATPAGDNDRNKYGAGILSASGATEIAAEATAVKLRHLVLVGVGCLLFAVGGGRRRSLGLRAAMAAALGIGMFGPDWWSGVVGADSAWNMVAFSALLPIMAFVLLRKGPGIKVAGALALGTALNLYANWHNDTLPFTTATFGFTAVPWTFANMGVTLGLGAIAAMRAYRAVNGLRRSR